MKYLFTVHSPITYLCALSIIEERRLELKDVVILTNRINSIVSKSIRQELFLYQKLNSTFKRLLTINYPRKVDNYLHDLTDGEKFEAFIDFLAHDQKIIITNKNCQRFNFIEEGTLSYISKENFRTITSSEWRFGFRVIGFRDLWKLKLGVLRVVRGYTLRLLLLPQNPSSYSGFSDTFFYAFSELCFPLIQNNRKEIIKFSQALKHLNSSSIVPIIPSNSFIWIDESLHTAFNKPLDDYLKIVDFFLKRFQHDFAGNTFYLKGRRGHELSIYAVEKLFNNIGIQTIVLPFDMILEVEMLLSKGFKVYGAVSSLLFYAALLGHSSFSIANLYPSELLVEYENDINGFFTYVEKLNFTQI